MDESAAYTPRGEIMNSLTLEQKKEYLDKTDAYLNNLLAYVYRLEMRVNELEDAITSVVTQKADNACWMDIYTMLGKLVGVTVTPEELALLPAEQMLGNCSRYVTALKEGTPYEKDNTTKHIDEQDALIARFRSESLRRTSEIVRGTCRTNEHLKQIMGLRELLATAQTDSKEKTALLDMQTKTIESQTETIIRLRERLEDLNMLIEKTVAKDATIMAQIETITRLQEEVAKSKILQKEFESAVECVMTKPY